MSTRKREGLSRAPMATIGSAAAVVLAAGVAKADFQYLTFDGPSLNLLGDAQTTGDSQSLLLTSGPFHTSAAWHLPRQRIDQGWESTFTFRITDVSGPNGLNPAAGADGFAFVVQNSSGSMLEDTVSGRGGGIGYNGGQNLLAVEFDSWMNDRAGDPNDNHISIHSGGPGATSSHENHSIGWTSDIPALDSGDWLTAKVAYEPGTMRVYLDDMQTPVIVASVDLTQALAVPEGEAWVGFTAAGTAAWQTHEVGSWDFTVVPSPGGLALLGMGGLVAGRRRR